MAENRMAENQGNNKSSEYLKLKDFFETKNLKNNVLLSFQLKAEDLDNFACQLAKFIQPGDCFLLEGEVGAGKTSLVNKLYRYLKPSRYKAYNHNSTNENDTGADDIIAEKKGQAETLQSPTFSILNVEDICFYADASKPGKLCHLDLYRIKKGQEICYLGLENEFSKLNSLLIIEWPYLVSSKEWQDFFELTQCDKPSRTFEIKIEYPEYNASYNAVHTSNYPNDFIEIYRKYTLAVCNSRI